MMKTRFGVGGIVTLALLFGGAQGVAGQEPVDEPYTGPMQVISVNPFGVVFEWFNVEYERRLSPTATLGAAFSYLPGGDGDDHYVSGNALLRYYPQGRALSGFFFGGRAGVYDVNDGGTDDLFFGAGFEVGYTWLLGVNDGFALSLGAGASRIFGATGDVPEAIPTIRLINVGLGF